MMPTITSDTTTNDDPSMDDDIHNTMQAEMKIVLNLAVPSMIIQVASVIPSFMVASYVGRYFGSVYLGGFMLANLTADLCVSTVLQGIFNASETLSPQAYGAGNYAEVGYVAIRTFVLSIIVIAPIVTILLFHMYPILLFVGEDNDTSIAATAWYRIYVLSLPFAVLEQVIWKFLSAQHIMAPLVVSVVLSSFIIAPIFLYLFGSYYGFIGTAMAMTCYLIFQPMVLLIYLYWSAPYDPKTWPGLFHSQTWNEVFKLQPYATLIQLGAGGILANAEWIYTELISLMIGTIGVVELSVHTIPKQVIMVLFMIPMGIGIALAIRVGNLLPRNPTQARHLCFYGILISSVLFMIMSVLLYVCRHPIYAVFTTEDDVIAGCEQIWFKVSLYFFLLGVFSINVGIAIGLGKQWTLGFVSIVFLWVLGLPASYFFAIIQGGGLNAAWEWILPPYAAINAVLILSFVCADWDEMSAQVRSREGVITKKDDSNSADGFNRLLLPEADDGNQHYRPYGSLDNEEQL